MGGLESGGWQTHEKVCSRCGRASSQWPDAQMGEAAGVVWGTSGAARVSMELMCLDEVVYESVMDVSCLEPTEELGWG